MRSRALRHHRVPEVGSLRQCSREEQRLSLYMGAVSDNVVGDCGLGHLLPDVVALRVP